MTRIIGAILLLIFIMYVTWLLLRFTIEANHSINQNLKKRGYNGNYYKYKKFLRKKSKC